jgi:hypothetical protein
MSEHWGHMATLLYLACTGTHGYRYLKNPLASLNPSMVDRNPSYLYPYTAEPVPEVTGKGTGTKKYPGVTCGNP